jgi:hypothetical protein
MTGPGVLSLTGESVADEPISLEEGWNLVGYNRLEDLSVQEALSSIAGKYSSVWTYEEDAWKRYVVDGPPYLNDLQTMKSGQGYWINATTSCVWDVNEDAPAASPPAALEMSRARTDRPGIPYTVWGSLEVDDVKFAGENVERSAATVFLKMDNIVQSSYRLGAVESYSDFYVLDVPEDADSSAQIDLYVQIGDTMMKAAPVPPGKPGQVVRVDLHIQIEPKASMLHQNYPNPFNPETWIPYDLVDVSDVRIEIYGLRGQLVRTLDLGCRQTGSYISKDNAAYWDGRNETGEEVASGVYFYTIRAGGFSATRKMTVLR